MTLRVPFVDFEARVAALRPEIGAALARGDVPAHLHLSLSCPDFRLNSYRTSSGHCSGDAITIWVEGK